MLPLSSFDSEEPKVHPQKKKSFLDKTVEAGKGLLKGVAKSAISSATTLPYLLTGMKLVLPSAKEVNLPILGKTRIGLSTKEPLKAAGELAETAGWVGGEAIAANLILPRISSFLATRGLAKTATLFNKVVEKIRPLLGEEEKIKAIGVGRGVESKGLSKAIIKPSRFDEEVAATVFDIVEPEKSDIFNVNKLRVEIGNEAVSLKNSLKQFDAPLTRKDTTTAALKLRSVQEPISIKSQSALHNAYEEVIGAAESLLLGKKTKAELLNVRQEFDDLVEQQLGKIWVADPSWTPVKDGVKKIRQKLNDIVADAFPEVKVKESLDRQFKMFVAKDNLAEKAVADEIGMNGLQQYLVKHPQVSNWLRIGTYAAPSIAGKGYGVGYAVRRTIK